MPAKKKKESHTGFRNGDLFCFHCGASFNIQMPIAISMMIAIGDQFTKDHKKCPKIWVQPQPDMSLSESERAKWWLDKKNGEHGCSSKTIFSVITNYPVMPAIKYDHPHDPDDFRRCYLLLQAVPEWKEKLYLLKPLSPQWSNLVDYWKTLSEMLEDWMKTDKPNGMNEYMQKLLITES